MDQVHLSGMKFFPLVAHEGRSTPSVNWGPLISRKLLELECRIVTHTYTGSNTNFGYEIFPQGRLRGTAPPSVNLEPPSYLVYC